MRITSIFIYSLLGASTLAYAADNKSNIYKKDGLISIRTKRKIFMKIHPNHWKIVLT